MRILYVEDNPANVFLVKRVAKMGQHEIINFIDGGEAIRKYDSVDPDLVLMDIQLVGETSGLEVVKALRGRGVTTPIIAVTAYAMVGDKERCMEAGCNDYLAKPLPIPRLIEIFQSYDVKAKEIRATQSNNAVKEAEVEATETKTAEPVKAESASETPAEKQPEVTETKTAEPVAEEPVKVEAVAAPEESTKAEVATELTPEIKTESVAVTSTVEAKTDAPVASENTDIAAEKSEVAPLVEAEPVAEATSDSVVVAQAEPEVEDSTLPAKPEESAPEESTSTDKAETSKTEAN